MEKIIYTTIRMIYTAIELILGGLLVLVQIPFYMLDEIMENVIL